MFEHMPLSNFYYLIDEIKIACFLLLDHDISASNYFKCMLILFPVQLKIHLLFNWGFKNELISFGGSCCSRMTTSLIAEVSRGKVYLLLLRSCGVSPFVWNYVGGCFVLVMVCIVYLCFSFYSYIGIVVKRHKWDPCGKPHDGWGTNIARQIELKCEVLLGGKGRERGKRRKREREEERDRESVACSCRGTLGKRGKMGRACPLKGPNFVPADRLCMHKTLDWLEYCLSASCQMTG